MSKKPLSSELSVPFFKVDSAVKAKLSSGLSKFQGQKILILGDVGLDEYVMGRVQRISPEAPVPVVEVESEDQRLGLAGNVAQNIETLGGQPFLVSVIGQDEGAERLKSLCQSQRLQTEHLIVDAQRPTTRKARIMASHNHIVRVDYESRKFLSPETEKKVLNKVKDLLPLVKVVIVEDYGKGFFTPALMKNLVAMAQSEGKPIYVDPHRSNQAGFYQGVTLIKPNFEESLALTGITYDDLRDSPDRIIEVGQALLKQTGALQAVVTRGKDGMLIFENGKAIQVPTFARKVFDVTGAGDTVIAALSMGLAAGFSLEESAVLANLAAGVVVAQIGCVPCTLNELTQVLI